MPIAQPSPQSRRSCKLMPGVRRRVWGCCAFAVRARRAERAFIACRLRRRPQRRSRHIEREVDRVTGDGLASLIRPEWVVPAAIAGGLYYGLAGLGHLFRPNRNLKEQAALVSDLAIFRLARRLRCEPCRLESAHVNYSVGTPEFLSSRSISPVSQRCSMRMLLANDHSGCVKAQGRFFSMKK